MLDALNTLALLADGDDPTNNTFGLGKPAPGGTIVAFKGFEVRPSKLSLPSNPISVCVCFFYYH